MSEQTLDQRLVSAWGAIKNPELDGANPHFGNKYATLKSTLGVIREACRDNGIAYMQRLVREDGGYVIKSSVTDGRTSVPMSEFPLGVPPNPQSFGSNLTYTKRQQAQADWCITGEEDDDGNAAAEGVSQKRPANANGHRAAKSDKAAPKAATEPAAKPPVADQELKAAKTRVWEACRKYAEKVGSTATAISDGVRKRPDYAESAEFFIRVAEELESEL